LVEDEAGSSGYGEILDDAPPQYSMEASAAEQALIDATGTTGTK
jgi:hypothetical protein